MGLGRVVALTLCLAMSVTVRAGNAQAPPVLGRDSARVLVLEHRFTGGATDSVVVHLE
jgi:hypothetical protein